MSDGIWFFVAMLFGGVVGFSLGSDYTEEFYQAEAVKAGCGEFYQPDSTKAKTEFHFRGAGGSEEKEGER